MAASTIPSFQYTGKQSSGLPWWAWLLIIIFVVIPLVTFGGTLLITYFFVDGISKIEIPRGPAPMGPAPMGPAPMGDTIIITDEGSKIETYIEPTMGRCMGGGNDPDYCGTMDENTEMSYVYDPQGGSINDSGNLQTTYDPVTRVCSDGKSDCVFTEKFDDERKLISITNEKGEDFIQKMIDDMWSDKLEMNKVVPSPNGGEARFKDQMKNFIEFNRDTGEMFFNRTGMRVKIIPGNMQFESQMSGGLDIKEIRVSVGTMIMYIIFYYYGNDLPKPTIKLDLTSEKTLGELYLDMMKAKPSQQP